MGKYSALTVENGAKYTAQDLAGRFAVDGLAVDRGSYAPGHGLVLLGGQRGEHQGKQRLMAMPGK